MTKTRITLAVISIFISHLSPQLLADAPVSVCCVWPCTSGGSALARPWPHTGGQGGYSVMCQPPVLQTVNIPLPARSSLHCHFVSKNIWWSFVTFVSSRSLATRHGQKTRVLMALCLLPCSASRRRGWPREGRPCRCSRGRPRFPSCPGTRSWSLHSSGTRCFVLRYFVSLVSGCYFCFCFRGSCFEALRVWDTGTAREEGPGKRHLELTNNLFSITKLVWIMINDNELIFCVKLYPRVTVGLCSH